MGGRGESFKKEIMEQSHNAQPFTHTRIQTRTRTDRADDHSHIHKKQDRTKRQDRTRES